MLKMGLIAVTTATFLLTNFKKLFFQFPALPLFLALGISVYGITWSIIGLANGSNVMAIYDSLRLYIFWSFAWAFLTHCISLGGGVRLLHTSFIISAFAISLINIFGVLDIWFALDLISLEIRDELKMYVGIHDGYIQVTSHNIGSIFFLANYFFIIVVSKNLPEPRFLNILAYLLLIVVAIISGRRALWLTLAIIHCLGLFLGLFSHRSFSRRSINKFVIIATGFVTFALYYLVVYTDYSLIKTIEHTQSAFSSDDARSIQAPLLIQGFLDYLWFGSGFGGELDYSRNDERGWLYEMVYHQLAFNVGLIGLLLACLFAGFILVRSLTSLNQTSDYNYVLAVHFGCLAFAIGCYSNPYIGSFDFMIYIWLLVLVGSKINEPPRYRSVGING